MLDQLQPGEDVLGVVEHRGRFGESGDLRRMPPAISTTSSAVLTPKRPAQGRALPGPGDVGAVLECVSDDRSGCRIGGGQFRATYRLVLQEARDARSSRTLAGVGAARVSPDTERRYRA